MSIPDRIIVLIVLHQFACAFMGAYVANRREAAWQGALLGLMFGPMGVVTSFASDARKQCCGCMERVERGAMACPHCRAQLRIVTASDRREYLVPSYMSTPDMKKQS